jgi:probable O-glycosylation ligase (exosortase A-associated)
MLRTLFVLAIFVPGLMMAIRDRFMALLLYLWFAFFRPQDWMWIDVTGLRLSLVLGLLLLVPAFGTGIWPNVSHILSVGQILFLVSALLAQLNAVNTAMGWSWIDFLVRLTLVCLLAVTMMDTPQRVVRVLAVVGGSLGFHAAKAGLASILGGGVRFDEGLTGTFVDNNGYALGAVMIIPLLIAVALNAELLFDNVAPWITQWVKRGFFVAAPLCAFTVISTFSRGGFLALAAAALVYIALHQQRLRLSMAAATLAVLALMFAPIPEGYFERLETISTYEEINEESAISRTHFWAVAIRMANDKPLGVGLRNYEAAYNDYDFSYGKYGQRRAVHSSHFQVLAEQGYLGAAIWTLQFVVAFFLAIRIRQRARVAGMPPASSKFLLTVSHCLIASMTGFIVGGAFIALALNDVTWLTFATLAAVDRLAVAMAHDAEQKPVGAPAHVPPTVRRVPAFHPQPAVNTRWSGGRAS